MGYGSNQASKTPGSWFTPGVNQAKIQSWSIQKNDQGTSLKIVYELISNNSDSPSTINEFISFPSSSSGQLSPASINRFEGLLKTFFLNFTTFEKYVQRLDQVGNKYGFESISTDQEKAAEQFEQIINALFDLVGRAIEEPGILICGYGAPKLSNGELKQYITPMSYGQGKIWKTAFRTNTADTEMPPEATEFADEKTRKYNYWSYTKDPSIAVPSQTAPVKPAQDQEAW